MQQESMFLHKDLFYRSCRGTSLYSKLMNVKYNVFSFNCSLLETCFLSSHMPMSVFLDGKRYFENMLLTYQSRESHFFFFFFQKPSEMHICHNDWIVYVSNFIAWSCKLLPYSSDLFPTSFMARMKLLPFLLNSL